MYNETILKVLLVFWLLSELIDLYGLAVGNRAARVISLVMRYCYLTLSTTSCVRNLVTIWRKYLLLRRDRPFSIWIKEVSDEDYFGFMAMLISIMSALGQALCPAVATGGLFFVDSLNPTYIIVYTSMVSVFSLVTCVIPYRVAKNNSFKLQDELDHRRVFVRSVAFRECYQ